MKTSPQATTSQNDDTRIRLRYLSRLGFNPLCEASTRGFRKTKSLECGLTNLKEEVALPTSKSHPSILSLKDDLVFIIDWDDTLFCTTFYMENDTSKLVPYLDMLCKKEVNLIRKLAYHGQVHIVTNAKDEWVNSCCRRFLPDVWRTLKKYGAHVTSAQAKYQEQFPDQSVEWKKKAFEDILRQKLIDSDGTRLKILTVGDSETDIEATQHLETYHF
eukprot:TRINITY_DN3320_c0_g1_i5.p1 TRINITY_DN3320_c0_g1~~TRINITY_DN3320_c0_g1_i5.p1  ORF type:complete len:217 (-),score=12.21 TRINITY_DN3320_c0_g1_i5:320-970(-)